MKKLLRVLFIIGLCAAMMNTMVSYNVRSQGLSATQYQISIDAAAHQRYGLYYPVTYMFQIPSGASGLVAQYRYNDIDPWTLLPTRTSQEFFNGVQASRFDYVNNTAYLSLAFTPNSDSVRVRILGSNGQTEVPFSYLGIAQYYDNRQAAVTVSLDDWNGGSNSQFNNAVTILSSNEVHTTVGIITSQSPNWSLIQQWINTGYVEAASHSRTHPCVRDDYQATGYSWQITESRDEILANLDLPNPYVPVYILPCGYVDNNVRQTVVDSNYLAARKYPAPSAETTFSNWSTLGAYLDVLYTYDTDGWGWDTAGTTQLRDQANTAFNNAYNAGGIYHLMDHPAHNLWLPGSYLINHVQHIGNRSNVWYAALGEIYLYRFVQERGLVIVTPADGSSSTALPSFTPTTGGAPSITPTTNGETPSYTPTSVTGETPTLPPTTIAETPTLLPTETQTPTPSATTRTFDPSLNYSLWDSQAVPANPLMYDSSPVELGVKFRPVVSGYVTGLKFYKSVSNLGQHLGHLWTADGQMLAEGTFTNETATGWQTMYFNTPVPVTAGGLYVASYHTSTGYFSMDSNYFTAGRESGPLYAPAGSEVGGNGVYIYGASAFPNQSYNHSNYWVDLIFRLTPPIDPTPTETLLPTPTNTPVPSLTATNTSIPVPTATDTPVPPSPTPTATLDAAAEYSVWNMSAFPSVPYVDSPDPIEVGMKFRLNVDGYVTGVRFYKDFANTGTHFGHLWSSTGEMIAEVTFMNEGASGWQTAYFANPVPVTANTTYVVSYFNSMGNFSVDRSYFETSRLSGPIYVPSSVEAEGNGVYTYSAVSAFPNQAYMASNYWVDVVFRLTPPAPTATPTNTPPAPTSTPVNTPTGTPAISPTPTAQPAQNYSFWNDSALPSEPVVNDAAAVEVGMKFRTDVNGTITGIRFYKGLASTSGHVGHLWSRTGERLAEVAFTTNNTTGWQTAYFSTPIAVTAGTQYIVSYYAPQGHYPTTRRYFRVGQQTGPLYAYSSNEVKGNGLYRYGASGVPNQSYNASNYWVDVVFRQSP